MDNIYDNSKNSGKNYNIYNKLILVFAIILCLLIIYLTYLIFNKSDRYYQEGLNYLSQGEYAKSIKYFDLIILYKSNEINKLKRNSENEKNISNLAIRKKELSLALFYRGYSYKMMENYNEAIQNFTISIGLNPTFAQAYAERSICFYEMGFYNKAIEDITIALINAPGNSEYYYNRASIYLFQNNYEYAIRDFSKSIELNKTFYLSYFNRAEAYRITKQYEDAIKDYQKSLLYFTKKEYLNKIFLGLGKSYYKIGDYKRSEIAYTKSIKYTNNPELAYFNLAILYGNSTDLDIKNIERAIEFCKKAVEYNNYTDQNSLVFLASLYYKQQDYIKAYRTQEMAIKVKPIDGTTNHKNLMEWYEIYKKKAELNLN